MCRHISWKTWVPSAFTIIIFSLCYVSAGDSYGAVRFEVTVYGDGLAHLRIRLQTNSLTSSVAVPIPKDSGNIIVTDGAGRLVQYEQLEDNLLIYTLGEEMILLEYDTSSLTLKEGPVWTLRLDLPVQGIVQLPENSTVIYLSSLPNSIEARGSSPVLNLAQGSWEVSYVMPLPATGKAPSTFTPSSTGEFPRILDIAPIVSFGVLAIVLAALYMRRVRRSGGGDLSPLDHRILEFIRSRGGKVFESEIRDELGLPKTSLWRRVWRLERMGYLRLRRVGIQNEVAVT
ncbi:hypothetical protein KEJ23_01020 [Candidatus Bathyarchaeota archaeon]|nr:hypothetical protein [Candidatus Bathyarchaeota archaeon]